MRSAFITVLVVLISSFAFAEPSEQPKRGPEKPDSMTFQPPPGVGSLGVRKMVGPEGVTTIVNEDQREITITENDDGITVSVNDGGQVREATGKDADTLRQEHPEAFELYNRYCKDIDHGGGIRIAGPGGAEVLGSMNRRIDGLGIRAMLVADPFVLAQLGRGVNVAKVYDDSRAAKMGLKQFDYIRAVNGKTVETVDELADAIAEAGDAKLKLEITRGGEKTVISE